MTDTVLRQDVLDAIVDKRVYAEGSGDDCEYAYICALEAATDAVNAIPAVTVTDEMVERAAITHWNNDGAKNEMLAWGELDQHDRDFLIKVMKDALVAALGGMKE